jgi:hypothetical protein
MPTTKTANWLIGSIIAILVATTFVWLNPPTLGRAFTKNQNGTSQQDQGTGANHKRTSDNFSW